ncbi:MAG: aminoacyl-tRNA hydrolase [Planctomycetes bacterium]|nr:aminoacyl-tRNA hydrolase [Planctomycetota bacterium]
MHVVVGLGNPGKQYEGTRHNLGFRVCSTLRERLPEASLRDRFSSRVTEMSGPRGKVLLLEPQTYMNLSGQAIAEAVAFYKVPMQDLLVVCDDFNLPLGRLRLRRDGSHGGHNGLRNIIECLGDDEFARLRMGIGPLDGRDPVEFCLGRFRDAEHDEVEQMIRTAADAVMCWLDAGLNEAMNRFNATGTARETQ